MTEYHKQGAGPTFVYVCGIEGTGKNFYKQAADLERDHTVITFPSRPNGRYEMDVLVDDLASVLRSQEGGPVTVLGESFGGLVVLATALKYPSAFERIILVNSFAAFPHPRKIGLGVALYSLLPYSLIKASRGKTARRTLFTDDIAEEDRIAFRENTRSVKRAGYLSRLRIIKRTDLRSRLPEIKVPVLIVAGTEDRLLNSVEAARVMNSGLRRSRVKLLEGTGHMALLSSRVRVRDWLDELAELAFEDQHELVGTT